MLYRLMCFGTITMSHKRVSMFMFDRIPMWKEERSAKWTMLFDVITGLQRVDMYTDNRLA